MKGEPYLASEDSALLRSAVGGLSGQACLEIGAGNGGNMAAMGRGFELVVGTDLVRPRMSGWGDGDFVVADLATCFRGSTFDLVLFNPPYLPSEEVRDLAVDGGKGAQVPLAFLSEALRVVKGSGTVVMLLSSETPLDGIRAACAAEGFGLTKVAEKHLFYERLSVYRIRKRGPREVGLD
jgi:release factor glutamine methyltransferase